MFGRYHAGAKGRIVPAPQIALFGKQHVVRGK